MKAALPGIGEFVGNGSGPEGHRRVEVRRDTPENEIGGVHKAGCPKTSDCLDRHRMKDNVAGTVGESIVVEGD